MNDLNAIAPITNCRTQTTATSFPCLRYTIYRRVSETFTAECIGFTVLRLQFVCDLFVILVFYNVFCDFGLFLCDFGCLRSR